MGLDSPGPDQRPLYHNIKFYGPDQRPLMVQTNDLGPEPILKNLKILKI